MGNGPSSSSAPIDRETAIHLEACRLAATGQLAALIQLCNQHASMLRLDFPLSRSEIAEYAVFRTFAPGDTMYDLARKEGHVDVMQFLQETPFGPGFMAKELEREVNEEAKEGWSSNRQTRETHQPLLAHNADAFVTSELSPNASSETVVADPAGGSSSSSSSNLRSPLLSHLQASEDSSAVRDSNARGDRRAFPDLRCESGEECVIVLSSTSPDIYPGTRIYAINGRAVCTWRELTDELRRVGADSQSKSAEALICTPAIVQPMRRCIYLDAALRSYVRAEWLRLPLLPTDEILRIDEFSFAKNLNEDDQGLDWLDSQNRKHVFAALESGRLRLTSGFGAASPLAEDEALIRIIAVRQTKNIACSSFRWMQRRRRQQVLRWSCPSLA